MAQICVLNIVNGKAISWTLSQEMAFILQQDFFHFKFVVLNGKTKTPNTVSILEILQAGKTVFTPNYAAHEH